MIYEVKDIAQKIISRVQEDCGDVMTNLKLQKLLYYMQGFHLAVFGKPLFIAEIEAWMYGPVVPEIYENYKPYGCSPLYNDDQYKPIEMTPEEEDLFDQVYEAYGQFSALKLMQMTHNEDPWKSVSPGYGNIIPQEVIKKYFETQIEN